MGILSKIFTAVKGHASEAGEAIVFEPDVPHGVKALEDSLVLDVFSPPRADWQRGDDAYLRGPAR